MYENVCRYRGIKKAGRGKKKFKIFLAILLLIVVGVACYYFFVVMPIVCSLSEEKIRSLSTKVISQSVAIALDESGVTYDDLVHITFTSDNEISLIQSDSVKVNKLVRRVTELVQENMDNLNDNAIAISLGSFTGIPFLYGLGPDINLKLVPIGTVNTQFNSHFESVGINQTRHNLSFTIFADVGLLFPAHTQNFSTSLEIEICESIIIGKIPQVYLDGGN